MKRIKTLTQLPNTAVYTELNSPVGLLTLIASPKGLHHVLWETDRADPLYKNIALTLKKSDTDKTLNKTKQQLCDYFQGKRKTFALPLVLNGSDFQLHAWKQLLNIPYATTISYAQQAHQLGDKNKARAVGTANGLNPLSIIIPCHRVISSNGRLAGFAGGLANKAYLLALEKKHLN